MTMELQGKSILIRPDDNPELSEGGLEIPKTATEKPRTGMVIDVGPGCELVSKGSKIIYPRKSASVIIVEGEELHFIIEDQLHFVYE